MWRRVFHCSRDVRSVHYSLNQLYCNCGINISYFPISSSKMGRFSATVQILLYYTELTFFIYILLADVQHYSALWWILLVWMLSAVILLNLVSVIRIKSQMDFYHKRFGLFICSMMHLILQGPFWRYVKVVCVYEEEEFHDFTKMSLFYSCVYSVPIMVFLSRSYLLAVYSVSLLLMIGCSICFLSSVISFTHFTSFNLNKEAIFNPATQVLSFLWRVFMIFARVSTLIWAFASPYYVWITLAVGVEFLLLVIWFQMNEVFSRSSRISRRLWLVCLAFAHLIDLTPSDMKVSLTWMVAYYSLNLSETIGVVILWHCSSNQVLQDSIHVVWVMAVLASFAIGLLMSLGVKSFKVNEDQTSYIQKALRCCCPGSKRERLERVSYIWDSYDTKNRLLSVRPMYTREQRQQHIDIIDNPLGVDDSVSLTNVTNTTMSCTAKSTTCSTAPVDTVSKQSSRRADQPQQVPFRNL